MYEPKSLTSSTGLVKEFMEVCHDSFKDVTFSNLYHIFDVLHAFCFSENVDTRQQHSRTYVPKCFIYRGGTVTLNL